MASKSDVSGTADRVERADPILIGDRAVRAYVPTAEVAISVKGSLERARGMDVAPAVDAINRIFNTFVTRHLVDPGDMDAIEMELLNERASIIGTLEAFLAAEPGNRAERRSAAKSTRRAPAKRAVSGA